MPDLIEFTDEPLVYGTPIATIDTDTLDNYKATYTITSTIEARATIRNSPDGETYTDIKSNIVIQAGIPKTINVYSGGKQSLLLIAVNEGESGTASLSMSATSFTLPLTVDEVRNRFKVQESEYDDDAIMEMIRQVYYTFEERTGRVWIGEQTVTDEYYEGDGSDILVLKNGDIQSITSVSIDDDGDDTYTDITTSYIRLAEKDGIIYLGRDAEVSYFPEEFNSVKVSYIYGNSSATEDVKDILLAMIKNVMFDRTDFTRDLENRIERYRRKEMVLV